MHLSWGGTQATDVVKSTLSGQDGSRENSVGGRRRSQRKTVVMVACEAVAVGGGGWIPGVFWLWFDVKDTAGSFLVRVPG